MRIFLQRNLLFWHSLFRPYQALIRLRHRRFFKNLTVGGRPLTEVQKRYLILNEKRNLIVAGAGTGKTTTIVGKVKYLTQVKRVPEEKILVLAFNRDAANQLKERIALETDELSTKVQASTFHAIGKRIVDRVSTEKVSLADFETNGRGKLLDKLISQIIENELQNSDFKKDFVRYFSSMHVPYKDEHHDFSTFADYAAWVRASNLVTLQNEKVKSYGELRIANFLFLHGIEYEYEADYKARKGWFRGNYKPDFFLPQLGVYIEYYGIDRRERTAPYIDRKEYLSQMEWKEETHKFHDTTLLPLYYYDLKEGKLEKRLEESLKPFKRTMRRISDEEALQQINKGVFKSDFVELIKQFISLYKPVSKTINQDTLDWYAQKEARSWTFLKLFRAIFEAYELHLRTTESIDFNDMILRASTAINEGKFQPKWSHIIVDEFQDISQGRYEFLASLLSGSTNTQLYCVGDDWQSINRFAGADVSLMKRFRHYFGGGAIVPLEQTWRFADTLLEPSQAFVSKNPSQLKKRLTTSKRREEPSIHIHRLSGLPNKRVLSWVADYQQTLGQQNNRLLILAHYWRHLPNDDELRRIKRIWGGEVLKPRTIHSAKGLEADVVLVTDLSTDFNGFPSTKNDDPLLGLILPELESYPHAEERRLLYVAMTRAEQEVHLLAGASNPSVFALELNEDDYAIKDHSKELAQQNKCPSCEDGFIVFVDYNTGFFGCSNHPVCKYKERGCTSCNSRINRAPEEDSAICSNESCAKVFEACPSCREGVLISKSGRNGPFDGCHTWPLCKFTRN